MIKKLKDIATVKVGRTPRKTYDEKSIFPKSTITIGRVANILGDLEILESNESINQNRITINTLDADVITNQEIYRQLLDIEFDSLSTGNLIPTLKLKDIKDIEIEVGE